MKAKAIDLYTVLYIAGRSNSPYEHVALADGDLVLRSNAERVTNQELQDLFKSDGQGGFNDNVTFHAPVASVSLMQSTEPPQPPTSSMAATSNPRRMTNMENYLAVSKDTWSVLVQ